MTSIQPNGPSTLFNDDVLAAQNKISSINVDAQVALIWQWLNDLIIALTITTRDDDTLADSIVRLRNLHPEVSSIIASAIGWQPKVNVRLATIANGNFNTAFADGQTVNGLVLVEDDRILIKDQTQAYRNGIYVVQSSGAPVRATDADTASELGYAYVSVSVEDPTYPNSAWVLTQTSDEITLETTDLTWALAYNVDLSPYILGTGTAGKIALWSTDKILTNSSIREANSRVTVGTAAAKAEIATLQTVSGETGAGGTRSLVENQGNSSGGAGAIFDVYSGATRVSSMEIKVNNAGLTAISSGTTGSRTVFMSDDGTTTTMANPLEIQPPATGTQAVPKNLVALLDGSQAFTATQAGVDPVAAGDLTTKNYVDNAVSGVGVLFPNKAQPFTPGVYPDGFIPVVGRKYYVAIASGAGGSGGGGGDGSDDGARIFGRRGGPGLYKTFSLVATSATPWDLWSGGGGGNPRGGSGGWSGAGGGGGSASKLDMGVDGSIILGGGGGGGAGRSNDNDKQGGNGGDGGSAGVSPGGGITAGVAGTPGFGATNGGNGGLGGVNPAYSGQVTTEGEAGSVTISPSTLLDNEAGWAFPNQTPVSEVGNISYDYGWFNNRHYDGYKGDDGFIIIRWYEA